jgi:hypothetical protein
MWMAHVACSGADCTEELEIIVDTLDELDRVNCECGYGFLVLSLSEAVPAEIRLGEVVSISPLETEEPGSQRRAA